MFHFLHARIVGPTSSGRADYAFLALCVIVFIQTLACFAVRRGSAMRVFEASSGASAAAACLFTLLIRGTYFPRQVIGTLLMCIWGGRLSFYLFKRGAHYKQTKVNVGSRIAWSVLASLPVVVANTKQTEKYRSTLVELVCIFGCLASVFMENRADAQKYRWFQRHDGAIPETARPGRNSTVPPVCSTGLWSLSRHVNVFFDLSFHWFLFMLLRPIEEPVILLCPITLTLFVLLLPGGIASQEMSRNNRFEFYPAYVEYKHDTPVLYPLQWVYEKLDVSPTFKRIVCLDLPLYDEKE